MECPYTQAHGIPMLAISSIVVYLILPCWSRNSISVCERVKQSIFYVRAFVSTSNLNVLKVVIILTFLIASSFHHPGIEITWRHPSEFLLIMLCLLTIFALDILTVVPFNLWTVFPCSTPCALPLTLLHISNSTKKLIGQLSIQ